MNCKRVSEVLFLFCDDEMEEDLRDPFRAHTDGCPACARRLDYTRRLLLLVQQCCQREAAPERLRLRILASLPHRRSAERFH